ncbi:PqqD family peptide modification chaperone [Treponema primitia]|uniref:PqqD family peptide modification chaperone n=1 Tax=Treponema primitia TaxID=88058 RepID=UPI0039805C97
MLYRQRQKTAIRIYKNDYVIVGYIENFQNGNSEAFESSGAEFLKAVSRKARNLEDLVDEISNSFADVDRAVIHDDAREFYDSLTDKGLLVSGETTDEIDLKDTPFSYSNIRPDEKKDHIPGEKKQGKSALALVAEKFGGKSRLWELRVEITNRCNERCVHCYIPMGERAKAPDCDIDTQLFNDVLSQCRKAGLMRLTLTGGEPMLHRNFLDFLKTAFEYDFFVEVFSNLTMLNNEIISALKSHHILNVRVSLYSIDPAIHDAITGIHGSFEKTFQGIQRLIEADIPVQIGCMVMRQNKDVFLDVKEWGKEHGIPVTIDPFIYAPFDHSGANLGSRLLLEELEKVLSDIILDDVDYLIALKYANSPVKPKLHDERVCGICTFSFSLSPTGDVYPCGGWQNCVLGNTQKEEILDIVENSPKVKSLRNVKRKDLPRCFVCEHIDFCHSCLMRNEVESPVGNMFEINEYFCAAAAIKHRLIIEKIQTNTQGAAK